MRLFQRSNGDLERQVVILAAKVDELSRELRTVHGDTRKLQEDVSETRHSLKTLRERYERYIHHK